MELSRINEVLPTLLGLTSKIQFYLPVALLVIAWQENWWWCSLLKTGNFDDFDQELNTNFEVNAEV